MDYVFILVWIALTLAVGTISIILGKRYSVAIPIAVSAATIALSLTTVTKIVMFGPYAVSAAIIVFSMTFLMTDLLSELWGKQYAQMAVWSGFVVMIMGVVVTQIALVWPAASFALPQSEAFALLYEAVPRITVASFVAYLLAQNIDVWLFHKIGHYTGGRHLWLRNNGSTIVSQFVDTVVFSTIAFYGILPLVPFIIGSWLIKVLIAAVDTPFVYAGVYLFGDISKQDPIKKE